MTLTTHQRRCLRLLAYCSGSQELERFRMGGLQKPGTVLYGLEGRGWVTKTKEGGQLRYSITGEGRRVLASATQEPQHD